MKKALLIMVVILGLAGVSQAQSKCFVNAGLKDEHRITLTIDGRKVTGDFAVVREYDPAQTETYPFTGTKALADLTIRFTSGKIPEALSTKAKYAVWTLVNTGDVEILRVKLYGMKYDVGRYEVYTADYESCEPSFSTLEKTAKTVSFLKGAKSATEQVAFTSASERKVFRVDVIKGRRFSVTAPGCGISYFNPDETPYDEDTAIDTLWIESAPLSGYYLFVISPAGEPGTCSVTFKTN